MLVVSGTFLEIEIFLHTWWPSVKMNTILSKNKKTSILQLLSQRLQLVAVTGTIAIATAPQEHCFSAGVAESVYPKLFSHST